MKRKLTPVATAAAIATMRQPQTQVHHPDERKESWDDLNELCVEVAMSMNQMLQGFDALRNHPLHDQLVEHARADYDNHVNVFHADMQRFTDKLSEIKQSHAHRTGTVDDMDDVMEYSRISMLYLTLPNEINATLQLSFASMFMIFSEGEHILREAAAKAAEGQVKGAQAAEDVAFTMVEGQS